MTYFVPFDGSELSRAALRRATAMADAFDEGILVFSVVKRDPETARENGWLDDDESFDRETVEAAIRTQVAAIAPEATVETESIDRFAPKGHVATKVRNRATEADPEVVFVGSENAGRVVQPLSSVGGRVESSTRYDVYLVRNAD